MPPEPTADQRAAELWQELCRRLLTYNCVPSVHARHEMALVITTALAAAEARGRRAGLEEGAKVAKRTAEEFGQSGALAEVVACSTVAATLRKLAAGGAPCG